MQLMTPEEWHAFLREGRRTGKLATVRPDGRPHVAPVWYVVDGDEIIFTTWHTTVKAANLRHSPQVAFCVDDEAPPYAFVLVEGVAQLDPHAPDLVTWTTHLARRYFGDELAESYGRRNGVEGEILVRIHPTKVVAQKGIAD